MLDYENEVTFLWYIITNSAQQPRKYSYSRQADLKQRSPTSKVSTLPNLWIHFISIKDIYLFIKGHFV